jgi:hypothetical protein
VGAENPCYLGVCEGVTLAYVAATGGVGRQLLEQAIAAGHDQGGAPGPGWRPRSHAESSEAVERVAEHLADLTNAG